MPCNLYLIFQIVEKPQRAAPSVRCLPSAWKTIGRTLGKKNRASFARHALKDTRIKKNILLCLGKDIQEELSVLCSNKHRHVHVHVHIHTLLYTYTHTHTHMYKQLANFSWDDLASLLKIKAPVLHAFLTTCVDVKRRRRTVRTDK